MTISSLFILGAFSSPASIELVDSLSPPRVEWAVEATTEGQWNVKRNRAAWANMLSASLDVRLWRGGQLGTAVLMTYGAGKEIADCYQDFSNINAPNRPFRLTNLGLTQQIGGNFTAFLGLRQADRDYWNTSVASVFTGASYGCLPTIGDNYHINVYPLAALGLHIEYKPVRGLTLQTSLYHGNADDRFDRIFRFTPRRDGVINLGSMAFMPQKFEDRVRPAVYMAGWNVGNHRRFEGYGRHTQAGFWVTLEQPLPKTGRVELSAAATAAHNFLDPEVATTTYNLALTADNLTRRGGTLGLAFTRAYYHFGHESDLEATFHFPLGRYFSLQPALHYLHTDNRREVVSQIRVGFEL